MASLQEVLMDKLTIPIGANDDGLFELCRGEGPGRSRRGSRRPPPRYAWHSADRVAGFLVESAAVSVSRRLAIS